MSDYGRFERQQIGKCDSALQRCNVNTSKLCPTPLFEIFGSFVMVGCQRGLFIPIHKAIRTAVDPEPEQFWMAGAENF